MKRKRATVAEKEYLRAFIEKDWGLPERLRLEQAADDFRARGPGGCLLIADGLRRYAHAVNPDYPSAEIRAADLADHERVHDLLTRRARGAPRR